MKKWKRDEGKRFGRHTLMALFAAAMLGLTACGSHPASDSYTNAFMGAQNKDADYIAEAADYGYDAGTFNGEPVNSGSTVNRSEDSDYSAYYEERKLIKTVNLDMETKEFDSLLASIEQRVNSMNGYIEKLNTYNGSRYSTSEVVRYSNMTVRIPKTKLNDFVSAVSEAANVINRSENVEDVTLAYVDMEGRRNSLKTEQERLLAMLEQADNLEDMLIIEERLSTVRYQLESMESQLRTYDNKVDFATVYMSINEVKELTPVDDEEETVVERIADGFMDSLENVGEGIVNIFVFIVVNSPYIVIWAVVIAAIIFCVKMINRRNNRNKQEKYRKQQEDNAKLSQAEK